MYGGVEVYTVVYTPRGVLYYKLFLDDDSVVDSQSQESHCGGGRHLLHEEAKSKKSNGGSTCGEGVYNTLVQRYKSLLYNTLVYYGMPPRPQRQCSGVRGVCVP